MKTFNGTIAVAPLDFEHNKGVKQYTQYKGFATSDKLSQALIPTTVVFDSDNFVHGQTVYFKSEVSAYPGVRNIMNLNGQDFVILLESQVVVASK